MMKRRSSKALMAFIIPFLLSVVSARAEVARDPGPRATGANDQPQPLDGLTSGQTALFNAGMAKFQEREAVKDGLGPTMNLDSCGGCHSQPTVGGTSPAKNPQFIFFNDNLKKTNRLPSFITENGPVREVRFKRILMGPPMAASMTYSPSRVLGVLRAVFSNNQTSLPNETSSSGFRPRHSVPG